MAHYTEKREATALLGLALEKLGWFLCGWKDDKSDSMTDYYDPESWRGVATKGEHVVCVGVSAYDVTSRSGKPELRQHYVRDVAGANCTTGAACETCAGSGDDPSGWTLEAARKEPRRYMLETLNLPYYHVKEDGFGKGGKLKCRTCSGRGFPLKSRTETLYTWPTFQANPGRSSWHVETGGRIVAKGAGVFSTVTSHHNTPGGRAAAVAALAAKIDANVPAVTGGEKAPESATERLAEGITEAARIAAEAALSRCDGSGWVGGWQKGLLCPCPGCDECAPPDDRHLHTIDIENETRQNWPSTAPQPTEAAVRATLERKATRTLCGQAGGALAGDCKAGTCVHQVLSPALTSNAVETVSPWHPHTKGEVFRMLGFVLRAAGMGDCTRGGITSRKTSIVCANDGDVRAELHIVPWGDYFKAVPADVPGGVQTMMGGNFITASDTRWQQRYPHPIPVHDRIERQPMSPTVPTFRVGQKVRILATETAREAGIANLLGTVREVIARPGNPSGDEIVAVFRDTNGLRPRFTLPACQLNHERTR